MDFNVIRPKPPSKKPETKPAPPPAAAAPASARPAPPPPPQPHAARPWPYMEHIDRISQIRRARSIEYTDASTWRMNFYDDPDEYRPDIGMNYEYHDRRNYPFHGGYGNYMPDSPYMLPRPPPHMALHPPTGYHHSALPGPPPPPFAMPPPDYHLGPPSRMPRGPRYHGHPYDPDGCMIM